MIIRLFPYLDYHESVILQKNSLKVLILIIKSTYQGWYVSLTITYQWVFLLIVENDLIKRVPEYISRWSYQEGALVYIEVRHDQHESKLVKEETSNKILYQLDSSAETVRSGGHADSSKAVGHRKKTWRKLTDSKTTEAGGQKALSARREGDWTCPSFSANTRNRSCSSEVRLLGDKSIPGPSVRRGFVSSSPYCWGCWVSRFGRLVWWGNTDTEDVS